MYKRQVKSLATIGGALLSLLGFLFAVSSMQEEIKDLCSICLLYTSQDMKNTIAIEETLMELKGQYTFVIVTHNLGQAKRIADQIKMCIRDSSITSVSSK